MTKHQLREINVITKPFREVQKRIGLVYPNSYSVGMSGFSVKLLYHLLNRHSNVYTERIFFQDKLGFPRSIETGKNLSQFDILAFTFQFELDYINAIKMLQLSGIPIYAKNRNLKHPLLIAGGPTVTANHEPLSDIFDVFFFGEFESVSDIFLDKIVTSKHERIYDTILTIPGFFPAHEEQDAITPVITQNLNDVNYPTAQVRPIITRYIKKMALNGFFLQISRGCSHGCHFCLIGKIFRPHRERSFPYLQTLIDFGHKNTQTNFISLIGSNTADHSQIKEILYYIQSKKLKFVLPSIRIDSGEDLLPIISNSGQKSLSIAPESGSDDVRYKLGKRFNNNQIINFIKKAQDYSIHQLKLYFILGLTSNPINEAHDLIEFINNITNSFPSMKFTFSVTPLVPKRGTKYERHCTHYQEIIKGNDLLKLNLKRKGNYKTFPVRWASIQAILSISGSELTQKMIKVAERGGSYQAWKKILTEDPINYYTKNYCS